MISVDYIMNALDHSKVRLPFFLFTLYKSLVLVQEKIERVKKLGMVISESRRGLGVVHT